MFDDSTYTIKKTKPMEFNLDHCKETYCGNVMWADNGTGKVPYLLRVKETEVDAVDKTMGVQQRGQRQKCNDANISYALLCHLVT